MFDSTCIIVGIIIGAGIYETSPLIASNVDSAVALILLWALGGIIALAGAMCYAELATAYPSDGGDYIYLTKAYGQRLGFVFAWAEYWIIRPGNVGMMAFVFARFAHDLAPLRPATDGVRFDYVVYASGAIILLTALNLLGVRAGKFTQNALTTTKVIALLVVFSVGMFLATPSPITVLSEAPSLSPAPTSWENYRFALILVLFTYGGWNEMSYVAAEVRDPRRNIFRALAIGTVAVTLIYLLVNLAFIRALGLQGTGESQAVAADVLRLRFGPNAGRMMSTFICLSCLGAINGLLFTGSRVFYAAGTDHDIISYLGQWSGRFDSPIRAFILQLIVTLGLIVGFGSEQGFERLLRSTTPVYWFFATSVGLSLFVLRQRDPATERPHRVVLYPLTPLLFCASSAFMLYSSATYAYAAEERSVESLWTVAILLGGLVVSLWSGSNKAK